ncbi:hypothetical protein PIB30_103518, partial [Stylosanthes scabra]|nr:hypothetical protein [Stylosanthes scabra]
KRRGSRELRVATNGASIGVPVWKLRPPEGGTTTTTLISFLSFLSFCSFFPFEEEEENEEFWGFSPFCFIKEGWL